MGSSPPPRSSPRAIATVDLTSFTEGTGNSSADPELRRKAGRTLVEACHDLGFVKITGLGISKNELDEAFSWIKRLFDLPTAEKMKAPHPAGNMPHRGYSSVGKEKTYSMKEVDTHSSSEGADVATELRKISDCKESYEIGSEYDNLQGNIWLPDDVLPGFRDYMTSLYERLAGVAKIVLEAIRVGLDLDAGSHAALMQLASDQHSQLRLLHYPALSKERLQKDLRFHLVVQDDRGGLELQDPNSHEYLHAVPEEGSVVLNIGDMLQRFSNDYFISPLHRVSVPDPETVSPEGIPARYSMPYFVSPAPTHTIATISKFITPEAPPKYEPVTFRAYGDSISKYQYRE